MDRRRSFAALAFSSLVYLATRAGAQQLPLWERIGPEGGSICALQSAPSKPAVVYAGGAEGGLYRSLDRGLTWSFAGRDLPPYPYCSLAVDARDPSRVWALTGGLLFVSSDGGRHWLPLDTPPGDEFGVVAHPRRAMQIYLHGNSGAFSSTDGGVTWKGPMRGLPFYVGQLVFDTADPSHVFALDDGRLLRSLDGGRRWHSPAGDLPESFGIPLTLAIDPRDGDTVYLASTSGRLLRSQDLGETFRPTSLPGAVSVRSLAASGRHLFVGSSSGLWVSHDHGRSFAPGARRLANRSVADVTALPFGILVSTELGIQRSPDNGATFAASQRGLRARSWLQLEIDPEHPDDRYALDRFEQILRSEDGGHSWSRAVRLAPAGELLLAPSSLALDPLESSLYANYATMTNGGALARTEDGGRSWDALGDFGCFLPFTVFPDAPRDRLFVTGGYLIGACGLQPNACAIFRSLDDGASWGCAKSLVPGTLLAVHPPSGDLYARTGDGLLRSEDWGDHWSPVTAWNPVALSISSADPNVFFGLMEVGELPYRVDISTDRGHTWKPFADNVPGDLYPDPFDAGRVYALTPHQLFVSDGGGWELVGSGVLEGVFIDLAFDPRDPGVIYAASSGGGLLRLRLER